MTRLTAFNALEADEAAKLLRPCLDVERWVSTVVDGRPYGSVDDLFDTARAAAHPLTGAEVEAALSHHPRIGEQADGASTEAHLSRSEQASLSLGGDVQAQLAEGNRAYEERFGRVFIVRAAGRSGPEILEHLRHRLDNTDELERAATIDQLTQIAVLRMKEALS